MGFLGVLQKAAAQYRAVKTFDSASRASRSKLGRFWSCSKEGRNKFNFGVRACSSQTKIKGEIYGN